MHWRETFQVESPEVSKPVLEQRLKQLALPIWKQLEKKIRGEYVNTFDDVLTVAGWVQLMNRILQGIPESAWPPQVANAEDVDVNIVHVGLALSWGDDTEVGLRMANLVFDNDDHTAWVVETRKGSGVYKDFDIGGS